MDELTDDNIARVTDTYHAWRNRTPSPPKGEPHPTPSPLKGEGRGEGIATYADIPGFCKSAPLGEVCKHGHVLTPGRYVGTEAQEEDGEPFENNSRTR